jgi:hypothetical protein
VKIYVPGKTFFCPSCITKKNVRLPDLLCVEESELIDEKIVSVISGYEIGNESEADHTLRRREPPVQTGSISSSCGHGTSTEESRSNYYNNNSPIERDSNDEKSDLSSSEHYTDYENSSSILSSGIISILSSEIRRCTLRTKTKNSMKCHLKPAVFYQYTSINDSNSGKIKERKFEKPNL